MKEVVGIAIEILAGVLEPQEGFLLFDFDKLEEFDSYIKSCSHEELIFMKNNYEEKYLAIKKHLKGIYG